MASDAERRQPEREAVKESKQDFDANDGIYEACEDAASEDCVLFNQL